MNKKNIILPILCFLLFSCQSNSIFNNSVSSDTPIVENVVQPAMIKRIFLNGEFVQTYRDSWPIALDSYEIEDKEFVFKGRFIATKEYYDNASVESIDDYLNKEAVISVMSNDDELTESKPMLENTYWEVNECSNEIISFSIHLDFSPIIEDISLLKIIYIYGDFQVFFEF